MKIYVASSWRNTYQPGVVKFLRRMGHEVYDFRNPISEHVFANDMNALKAADACVIVGPCGRSAHLEFGYAVGAKQKTVVYLPEDQEPELMYKAADAIVRELHHVQLALFGGHSMGRYLPCSACGDLDGCWKWREAEGNEYDSRTDVQMGVA